MNVPKELRDDLRRTALMLRMRAKADDPLDCLELRQLVRMLLNMSEGRGALAPRDDEAVPTLTTIPGGIA